MKLQILKHNKKKSDFRNEQKLQISERERERERERENSNDLNVQDRSGIEQ